MDETSVQQIETIEIHQTSTLTGAVAIPGKVCTLIVLLAGPSNC